MTFKIDDGNNLGRLKYDAILSAAAPLSVPSSLKERLAVGGRLILPVGDSQRQVLTLIHRIDNESFEEKRLEDVLFVPLLKGIVS